MRIWKYSGARAFMCAGIGLATLAASQNRLEVDVAHPGVRISPTFYGLMTEEINHAYDGGLYAELVQNRSFADNPTRFVHWSLVADEGAHAAISLDHGPQGSPATLLVVHPSPDGRVGIANDGFWGIPVRPHTRYNLRVDLDQTAEAGGPLDASIESADGGRAFATGRIEHLTRGLHTYRLVLRTGDAPVSSDNRLVLRFDKPGEYRFHLVSLFPPTFRNRPNGLRPDLMRLMGEMRPSFLRLPGGNYLEGNTIATRFDWQKTIGDIVARPGHAGPWGYRSSDGLGLMEFLTWCQDLRMEPLLAVYAGYSLQGEHVPPGPDLAPFVEDALREIEFLVGDAKTPFGSLRAQLGHPRPFPLTYVEVGNEDEFDRSRSYDGRFTQFFDAIRTRFPKLKIIATAPVHSRTPDLIDDHYYRSADAMARDWNHYDAYPRSGPKIFVGEWASTEGTPTPTLKAALGDAAWLMGLERNSDLVVMESYAPLLVNVNRGAAQWGTNLIGYDALTAFGSPSFFMQSLFAANSGDVVLPTKLHADAPPAPAFVPHGGIGLGSWRTSAAFRNISVEHDGVRLFPSRVGEGTKGWTPVRGAWTITDQELTQTTLQPDTHAIAGDPTWKNYTYRVQARKISGDEGFLIQFHVHDGDFWQWNVGGWNDTRTALQRIEAGNAEEVGPSSKVTVQPGHWYDVRIELRDGHIRCYLDDELVSEGVETPRPPVGPLFVSATRDLRSGDVILKVVNMGAAEEPLDLDLRGVTIDPARAVSGGEISGKPTDQNTVAAPTRVTTRAIRMPASSHYRFPPYSITALRIPVTGAP